MKVVVGDVVHLKGSKVEMVVREVGESTVVCAWHDVDGHPVQHEYKQVMLVEHAQADLKPVIPVPAHSAAAVPVGKHK